MQRSIGASKKHKGWMDECKQLISQYLVVNQTITAENQGLRDTVAEIERKLAAFVGKEGQLHKKIEELEREKVHYIEENQAIRQSVKKEREGFKSDLESKMKELQKQMEEKKKLEEILKQKQYECKQLEKSNKISKTNLAQTHSHIKFLKTQIQTMRNTFHQHERQYEEQIQKLKDLNHDIKKQFSNIQRDYIQIIKINNDDSIFESPHGFSKPKGEKTKTTHRSHELKQEKRSKSINVREKDAQKNPEMTIQLKKIKKEIANQYTKLNQTKQSYLQERVNKTIQNIETLCSQMSFRLHQNSSTYE